MKVNISVLLFTIHCSPFIADNFDHDNNNYKKKKQHVKSSFLLWKPLNHRGKNLFHTDIVSKANSGTVRYLATITRCS